MEIAHKPKPELWRRLLHTRGGTLILAGAAALIAAIAVFVYVSSYRDSVKKGAQPATVLVAKSLIPKGTPGEQVATRQLFQVQSIRESQLREGAISDPASLRNRVAARDVFPGQQLTAADFKVASDSLTSKLAGAQRAITLPMDAARGMLGYLSAGDRVDVYASFNVVPVDSAGRPLSSGAARPMLRLIAEDVPVLAVSKASGISSTRESSITLRAAARETAEMAFAAEEGKVWLVQRPPTGAKPAPPDPVTVETVMLGVPPVTILRSFGGR